MGLLTRLGRPFISTQGYERLESADLLWGRWRGQDSWTKPFAPPERTDLPALDGCFDEKAAQAALEMVKPFRAELEQLPSSLHLNGFFGPADVAFYWSFIRSRRPETVLEVGSGYSSRVALRALAKNQQGRLICVDPSPRLNLPARKLTHIAGKVEEVNPSLFADLKSHDIVYIDSSHKSDEVSAHAQFLDSLPKGILVHYHDIDYPWERQQADWDEDVIVANFLAERPDWKVLVYGSALSRDHLADMRTAISLYQRTPYRRYNGLWLVKN